MAHLRKTDLIENQSNLDNNLTFLFLKTMFISFITKGFEVVNSLSFFGPLFIIQW